VAKARASGVSSIFLWNTRAFRHHKTRGMVLAPIFAIGATMSKDPASQRRQDDMPDNDALLQAIGVRIQQLRAKSGLSGKQLADKAGLSLSFVYQVEGGTQNFTIQAFRRLVAALDANIEEVFYTAFVSQRTTTLDKLNELSAKVVAQMGVASRALSEARALAEEIKDRTTEADPGPPDVSH
jgi:transcriptional regulator with XRE-family HTH domain